MLRLRRFADNDNCRIVIAEGRGRHFDPGQGARRAGMRRLSRRRDRAATRQEESMALVIGCAIAITIAVVAMIGTAAAPLPVLVRARAPRHRQTREEDR